MEKKVIVGFSYCENEEYFLGVFKTPASFIKKIKKDADSEPFDYRFPEDENKRLDWGMDCTFKIQSNVHITEYGYKEVIIQ